MHFSRVAKISMASAITLVLLGAAGGLALTRLDWKPLIESRGSHSLERELRIGSLSIAWGMNPVVELRDLALSNAAWGSEPEMLRIARASGQVELWPLLRGRLRYRRLTVDGLKLLLERSPDGRGNWQFGKGHSSPDTGGGPALIPANRQQFPTLLKAVLDKGEVRYKTSSGALLKVDLASLTVRSDGDTQPVFLAADGAYNGTPINLVGETASFEVMRDATLPYAANLSLASRSAVVDFQGSMMEPLDFEGVRGRLTGRAGALTDLLRAFGSDIAIKERMELDGLFARTGDRWTLTEANARLADSRLKGSVMLREHGRHEPDEISLDLNADTLDVDRLTKSFKESKGGDPALTLADDIDTRLAMRLSAGQVRYNGWAAEQVNLDGSLMPAAIHLDRLSFHFGGGTIVASGRLLTDESGGRLTLNASVEDVEAGALAQRLGNTDNLLTGKIDIRADLTMSGKTFKTGLKDSDGSAVFAMSGGRAARAMIEKLSTDIRSLFRDSTGQVQVGCFYSSANLRNGIATLSPLRLRTSEAAFNGGGTIDLRNRTVDIRVKSDREASGTLSLDLPLHISGAIADPGVGPGKDAPLPGVARIDSPFVQELADKKACR
jgi:uncharacterized protein involved in outer membrane biogenesis